MPGVPTSVVLLLSFPIIYNLPFDLLIAFYICTAICTQFSNSVIALYAGIPGDLSVLPILKERNALLSEFSLNENLIRTAFASVIGTAIGFLVLSMLVLFFIQYSTFLLRTEILFSVILFITIICLFWHANCILINLCLILSGCVLGITGYNSVLLKEFFTFGNFHLYGGIPVLPAFIALYAVPNLIQLNNQKQTYIRNESKPDTEKLKLKNYYSAASGGIIGSFVGLIPLLGSYASSNAAYWFARALNLTPLEKAIASESSNSAAFVVVLAPLLAFGIAIVPSEIILLEILRYGGWELNDVTEKTLYTLFLFSIGTTVAGYFTCTKLAGYLVKFIAKSGSWLPLLIIGVLIFNLYIIGNQSSNVFIYFITFTFCAFASLGFQKMQIDPIPLIFSWALGEQLLITGHRLVSLYF